ncbi:MAG: hypothetical protein LBF81_03150 [Prevotellaceae bacterium]|nr:hypothetical protein [Prevotellaceae bacterium]
MKQQIYIDTSVIGGYFDKGLDCVKMMRNIRDEIDAETTGMSSDKLRACLDRQYRHTYSLWSEGTKFANSPHPA